MMSPLLCQPVTQGKSRSPGYSAHDILLWNPGKQLLLYVGSTLARSRLWQAIENTHAKNEEHAVVFMENEMHLWLKTAKQGEPMEHVRCEWEEKPAL